MQSTIDICNVALTSYIGSRTITSLDEPSPEAEACSLHYDRIRRSMLQRWPWYWAGRREVLVGITVNDREGAWAFRYARPAHMIAIRWVNHMDSARVAVQRGQTPDTLREITADSIYSDIADASIEFTRDETDPTLFPPAFADALAAGLAAAIAMPITRDAAKKVDAQRDATMLLNQAMTEDFNQRPANPVSPLPEALRIRGLS